MHSENEIVQAVFKCISNLDLGSLKKAYKGRAATTIAFRDTMTNWYGQGLPWPLVEPDLILIFEDVKKTIDETMIVAIEAKYFENTHDLDKRLRQAFREVGQPLRNLMFGFDSTVLWHIFSSSIEEQKIRSYTNMVDEVITRLKLPCIYIASTILNSEFQIHKPSDVPKCDLQSLVMWLHNLCRDNRNPAMNPQMEIRRKSLKVALQIPT